MQDMQALKVDASNESEANDIANDIADLVGFLRRFASMISGGENADKLQDAAALIEDLVDALDRERKEFRDVETRLMQNVRAHAAAQVEIGSAKAELSVLQNEMAEQQRKAAADRNAIFNEAQEQSLRGDKAERLLREANDELQQLRTKFSEIGQSFAILPVSTMDALRAQFEFLGRQFGRMGDATSQAMCEVGACTISEAVADSLKQTKA
jgi:chromosome segregation ATPase